MTFRNGKKTLVWLLLVFCIMAAVFGCAAPVGEQAVQETPEAEPVQTPMPIVDRSVSSTLVGFVIPDDGSMAQYTVMHGFLKTAENLGYPAKIYRAAFGAKAEEAVQQAKTDGCAGLLIWNPEDKNTAAITRAKELGLPTVLPYYGTQNEAANASVVTDLIGYTEEVARGVAERMVERECKAGKILVYGKQPTACYQAFVTAINSYYPQYHVDYFVRTAVLPEAAVDELANHILWNRDIKGLFCTDEDGAAIAVKARVKAQREYKANGAPELATPNPKATPTPAPATPINAVPGATPVPAGLIKSITISVAGVGISDENIALMEENDIYAFVEEPYYEAGAQALMLLDRILNGETVPETTKLNMPIVRMDTLDKYRLIYQQVQDWFSLTPPAQPQETT
ncbi:MAG: hypothetical protein PHO41_01780 [Eubacteriales bacterium]|nr:hypothetical protein [Eubacteriales bacterium]